MLSVCLLLNNTICKSNIWLFNVRNSAIKYGEYNNAIIEEEINQNYKMFTHTT